MNHPVVKELYYFKGMALLQSGNVDEAKKTLAQGLRPMQEAKDFRKMCSTLEQLASLESKSGNVAIAKKLLTDAIGFAAQGQLKEERKSLKRKLEALA